MPLLFVGGAFENDAAAAVLAANGLRSIEVPNDGGVSHYSASNGYIYDDELTDGSTSSCSDDEDAVQKNEEQQREQEVTKLNDGGCRYKHRWCCH